MQKTGKATQHTLTRVLIAVFALISLGCAAIMVWVGTQGSASVKDTGHYMGAVAAFAVGVFVVVAVILDFMRVGDLTVNVRGSFAAK